MSYLEGLNGETYQQYNQKSFNELTSRRPDHFLMLLKQFPNSNVLHSDVDTVWLKDPRPYLKGNHDFYAQLDGVIDGKPYFTGFIPYFCTGFLAFRNTVQTMKFIETWKSEMISRKNSAEQVVFNYLTTKHCIIGRPLPMKQFACGPIYFEQMPKSFQEKVVVVHNNFVVGLPVKAKVHNTGCPVCKLEISEAHIYQYF